MNTVYKAARSPLPEISEITPGSTVLPPQRSAAMDLLRILASILVVLIHTASQNWYTAPPFNSAWHAMNIFDSIARPAVPLFLMLSGAFMLAPSKTLSTSSLWQRRIPRLACAYALWSIIYGLYSVTRAFSDFSGFSLTELIKSAVDGQYHLWYMPVIIMLYALLPLLRKILSGDCGKRSCEYMLLLFLVLGVLRETVFTFEFRGSEYFLVLSNRFSIGSFWAYTGYFLLGFYLYRYRLPRKLKRFLYASGIIAVPVTASAVAALSILRNSPDERLYSIFTPMTLCCAASIFVFFRDYVSIINFAPKAKKASAFIARCSLGIYLSHVLFLNLLSDLGKINTFAAHAALSVPCLTIVVWTISLLCTALYKTAVSALRSALSGIRSIG